MTAPTFTITALQPAHFPACAAIMGASDPWVTLGVSEEKALAGFMRNGQPGVVAVDDTGVLGFVRYEPRGFINHHAYIRIVAVAERARGRGVGEALVSAAETICFKEVPLVFLFCSDFNTRGQKFYQRIGYTRVGAVPAFLDPAHGEVLFFKRRPSTGTA